MERGLGIKAEAAVGSFGQFDVFAVVASKTGAGVLARLLGRGEFPDEDEVLAAVETELARV